MRKLWLVAKIGKITMKIILWTIIFLFTVMSAVATGNCGADVGDECWVDDETTCPQSYQSVNCGANKVCGYSGGTQCYDTTSFSFGSSYSTYSGNPDGGVFNGGGVFDCYSYDGTSPFCDSGANFECDRNSAYYGAPAYRNTLCTGFGVSAMGTCKTEGTNHYNCYGNLDCESTATSDCENSAYNHYNTATCETDASTAGSGTCVCDSGRFACDGSIVDGDGCEIDAGASCGSNTGYIVQDECYSSAAGNCTAHGARDDNRDCDDSDSDGDEITCNVGNGCEITLFVDTDNPNSEYQTCTAFECVTGYLDCDGNGNGDNTGNGCEIHINGATGEDNSHWGSSCDGTGGTYTCDSGFLDCNSDLGTGGDGCEVEDGTACFVGSVEGTYNGCTCEVDPQDIGTTGVELNWSGSLPLLWLHQYGVGSSIFTNHSNGKTFIVNSSGAFFDGSDLSETGGGGSGGYTSNNLTTKWIYDESGVVTYNETLGLETYWSTISDLPTATPSNGDTTHVSTADQIFDWVTGLGYSTESWVNTQLNSYYLKTEIDSQGEMETIWGVTLSTDSERTNGLASQDACSEITNCVVGAITDGNTNWDNSYNLFDKDTDDSTDLSDTASLLYETELDSLSELDTQIGITGTASSSTFWRGDNTWNTPSDEDTTYSAGNGISLSTTTFSVSGGTCLNQDSNGLSVTNDCVGDTQLAFNTGQHLTTSSNPTFATMNTGQGANELYEMNQNVKTDSDVVFGSMNSTGDINVTETAFVHNLSVGGTCFYKDASGNLIIGGSC